MAKKLKEKIRSIDKVTICIFAFRAEAKSHFGCYRKSDIDLMTESQLCRMISKNEITLLKDHLYTKSSMGDTVIDMGWMERLENAINEMYEKENADEVKRQVVTTKERLLRLKEARAYCSDYSQTEAEEEAFAEALRSLADLMLEGACDIHE